MRILSTIIILAAFCWLSAVSSPAQTSSSNIKGVAGRSKTKSSVGGRHRKRRRSEKMSKQTPVKKAAVSRKIKRSVQKQTPHQPKNEQSGTVQTVGQTIREPIQSAVEGAGTFDGDLRQLPQTKPIRQERPPLRQSNIKPRIYVRNPTIKPD